MDALNKTKTVQRSGPSSMKFSGQHFEGTAEQVTVVGKNAYQKINMSPLVQTMVWTKFWANQGDCHHAPAAGQAQWTERVIRCQLDETRTNFPWPVS